MAGLHRCNARLDPNPPFAPRESRPVNSDPDLEPDIKDSGAATVSLAESRVPASKARRSGTGGARASAALQSRVHCEMVTNGRVDGRVE